MPSRKLKKAYDDDKTIKDPKELAKIAAWCNALPFEQADKEFMDIAEKRYAREEAEQDEADRKSRDKLEKLRKNFAELQAKKIFIDKKMKKFNRMINISCLFIVLAYVLTFVIHMTMVYTGWKLFSRERKGLKQVAVDIFKIAATKIPINGTAGNTSINPDKK